MWNQASSSATPGSGGASAPPGAAGGNYSNAVHTPGAFAQQARPANLVNSPSAHRRMGGGGSTQHASPSHAQKPLRPASNVAFPGTVSAPRSAVPPNSAAALQKSLRHLPLLTTRTPASLAKLAFPPETTVFWCRVEKRILEPGQDASIEHLGRDAAAAASTSQAGALDEVHTAWELAVQDVISRVVKPRSRSHSTEGTQQHDHAALDPLIRDPLVYTSSASLIRSNDGLWGPRTWSRRPFATLWLFVVAADNVESASHASTQDAGIQATQPGNKDQAGSEAPCKDPTQPPPSSTPFDPKVVRRLSPDLVKALTRLTAIGNVESGSYSLASAASTLAESKGKQSFLTSEQRKVHKLFIASVKARIVNSILERSPVLHSEEKRQGEGTQHVLPPRASRPCLRLGDNIVFLPPQRHRSHALSGSDPGGLPRRGREATFVCETDQYSLVAEIGLSVRKTSLLVRSAFRRLAALSLVSSPHVSTRMAAQTDSRPALVLLAPLGYYAELFGVVPNSSIADEHLVELRSLFANLTAGQEGARSDHDDLFAPGMAICALDSSQKGKRSPLYGLHSHFHRQQTASHDAACGPGENKDEGADVPALSTIDSNEQSLPHGQEHERKNERHLFFWPVTWCLVAPNRTEASARQTDSALLSHQNLQRVRSQPITPLKELVSFSLKVLNDANETAVAQNTIPHTPGETEDAALLARNRVDHLPSTRSEMTPGSSAFPDFDSAMPAADSGISARSQQHTAAHSIAGMSPTKRDAMSADFVPGSSNSEAFGEDLNWMRFLPQASQGEASASATTDPPTSVDQADPAGLPASDVGTGPIPGSLTSGRRDSKDVQANSCSSNWAAPSDATTALPHPGVVGAHSSKQPTPHGLLQPHGQMLSQGSTPFQAHDNTTPLGFAQPSQTKRKAGETDIFGNLGLLTEDDFSFFDESAFGLEPESTMPGTASLMPPQLDDARDVDRPSTASSHKSNFPRSIANSSHSDSYDMAAHAVSRPVTSTISSVDDVAMHDLEQNSLDALFSAIPGLQDVMMASETSQARDAPRITNASSAAMTQGTQPGHEAPVAVSGSAHPFHSAMSSFTPRDASGTTPFGDPASLPGFTPSSLTESSPAFGNPSHKTPRTPYSPVEEYRDGAMIVDLQHVARMGDSAQSYRESNAASAPDETGHHLSLLENHQQVAHTNDEKLRLADASTAAAAAAAAAKAAIENDTSSRKRPAIVPDAFLPLAQSQTRKTLQMLATGARANLGHKYDLLGKFASKPKTSDTIAATVHPANVPSTDKHLSKDVRKSGNSAVRTNAPGKVPLASQLGLGAAHQSPPRWPFRRGQALLQLRRDRRSQIPPGTSLSTSRAQRMLDGPSTPRSSDDIVVPEVLSESDSDTSSFEEEEDGEEALSDSEGTMMPFSAEDQALLKGLSREIVVLWLQGAFRPHSVAESPEPKGLADQVGDNVAMQTGSAVLSLSLSFHQTLSSASAPPSAESASAFSPPTLHRWMLTRTAEWIIQNPQFRSMYRPSGPSVAGSSIAIGDKIEVLEALASALRIAPPSEASSTERKANAVLPTLQSLVRPSKGPAAGQTGDVAPVEVLEPAQIAVGCQGSVVETLPSSLMLWEKSKLSAVSGEKHVVAKVLLTYASPAWYDEIVAWLERLRVVFETHGLGTHVGGVQSILAVADGSESLSLSDYLDRLWKDGETWLDTLRSIAGRVQFDLLQGKHVVVYTLQSPNFSRTGFHGLLRLEADLKAMLSEQVGVLAEQLLVRPVSPSLMTESGSLGFSQQAHSLRRLAFSVYDQLPRLVRRQPAKVLHGREPGPISAVVQFPAFSLTSRAGATAGRTSFSLSWPQEPGLALDEHVLLHVAYRICHSQPPTAQADDGCASSDPSSNFGAGIPVDGRTTPASRERLVMVSAMDERGGSSTVNVLDADNGDSSIEACIERAWRFALGEASRARVRWRLAISSAGLISEREQGCWQRLIEAYLAATDARDRVMASVVLLSIRPDESGAILAERGGKTTPNQEWTLGADKASSVLLDAADLSQVLRFEEPMSTDWTQSFGAQDAAGDYKGEMLAMPVSSAILVHRPRQDLLSSSDGLGSSGGASCATSHVLAVDLLQCWTQQPQGNEAELGKERVKEDDSVMDAILGSLHQLRLVSEERHQLPFPYNSQPWPVAAVNTLTTYLQGAVLAD